MAGGKNNDAATKSGEIIGGLFGLTLIVLFLWVMVASQCSKSSAPDPSWPVKKYAQAVAGSGAKVQAFEQIGKDAEYHGKYFVQISIPGPATFWGGAEDWNMFASRVASISQALLKRPDVVRVRIVSHAQKMDWAYADLKREELPQNFAQMTYLRVASMAHFDASTLQTSKWLCEFYNKYESARPHQMMPQWCDRYAPFN